MIQAERRRSKLNWSRSKHRQGVGEVVDQKYKSINISKAANIDNRLGKIGGQVGRDVLLQLGPCPTFHSLHSLSAIPRDPERQGSRKARDFANAILPNSEATYAAGEGGPGGWGQATGKGDLRQTLAATTALSRDVEFQCGKQPIA